MEDMLAPCAGRRELLSFFQVGERKRGWVERCLWRIHTIERVLEKATGLVLQSSGTLRRPNTRGILETNPRYSSLSRDSRRESRPVVWRQARARGRALAQTWHSQPRQTSRVAIKSEDTSDTSGKSDTTGFLKAFVSERRGSLSRSRERERERAPTRPSSLCFESSLLSHSRFTFQAWSWRAPSFWTS